MKLSQTFSKVLLVVLFTSFFAPSFGSAKSGSGGREKPHSASVVFDGNKILTIQTSIQSFTPEDRAAAIAGKLRKLTAVPLLKPEAITAQAGDGSTDLVDGDLIVMSVTDADARASGLSRDQLALQDLGVLRQSLENYRKRYSLKAVIKGGIEALLASVFLIALLVVLRWAHRKADAFVEGSKNRFVPRLGIQRVELLSARQMVKLLKSTLNLIRLAVTLFLFYIYLPLVLSYFPWTTGLSGKLFGYFWTPLRDLGVAVVTFLPNLIFIVVVLVVVRYLLKFIRLFFDGIRRKKIILDGFYSDWADPTYQIVRVVVLALTAVVIFPYLPGSNSIAFKGVSVFLGLLLSLGSGSAVANSVAGIILTYMRPFQVGDRVMIGDTTGDVEEKNLLVTRIHTIKNEVVTIPNAMVLGNHMINYSSSAHDTGLILHTAVTLGYEVPWRKAHELLIAAALSTENIMTKPKPFVLQTALGDFNVSYELNVYTDQPEKMAVTYSDLHQGIQDQFNKAGVEIMSPHYASLRDGNQSTVPAENLPKDYSAAGFRISKTEAGEAARPE
ncbi:MAG: mechanosensitive ion channel family protein [bacterium]